MLSDHITTGTRMRYEKRIAGMVVRGFGRYKLHRPMQQSTFEFWSDDPRSPIRRGVGLWRYVPAPDGSVEFRTSYDYEVRWGILGRVLDRVILRGWFQRETERSFARLRREFFADAGSRVVGRCGRKPAPCPELACDAPDHPADRAKPLPGPGQRPGVIRATRSHSRRQASQRTPTLAVTPG